jgi:ribosomal protein L17
MKLTYHTSQHSSPGYTSLALGIAYTDGLLNEEQISSAIQLASDAFISSISSALIINSRQQRVANRRQASSQTQWGDSLDEILEQVLRQGSHLSTV